MKWATRLFSHFAFILFPVVHVYRIREDCDDEENPSIRAVAFACDDESMTAINQPTRVL